MSELTPYLCVADARAAIAGYADVLGAAVTVDPIEAPRTARPPVGWRSAGTS